MPKKQNVIDLDAARKRKEQREIAKLYEAIIARAAHLVPQKPKKGKPPNGR